MAELEDFQYELGGIVFGLDAPVHATADGFKPSGNSPRTSDTDNPVGDGGRPGKDRLGIETWAFDLFTIADEAEVALDDIEALAAAWTDEKVRLDSGVVVPLRYALPGRRRVVFGRPNRWTETIDNRLLNGFVAVTADFRVHDPLRYDDVLQSREIGLAPGSEGGVVAPVIAPVRTTGGSTSTIYGVRVGGTKPTPVTIRFDGPVGDPEVEAIGHWKVGLDYFVAHDNPVTLSGQMNFRKAVTQSGMSVGGKLRRGVRLANLVLPPGDHQIAFRGVSETGAATATILWRDAY